MVAYLQVTKADVSPEARVGIAAPGPGAGRRIGS
jgi:hypothetical protein